VFEHALRRRSYEMVAAIREELVAAA